MNVSAKKLLRKNADVEKTILHKSVNRKSIFHVRIYVAKQWTVASISVKINAVIRRYIYAILFVQRVFNAGIISVFICVIRVIVDHVMSSYMAMYIAHVASKKKWDKASAIMRLQYVLESAERYFHVDTNALKTVIMENVEIARARLQNNADVESSWL